MNSCINLTYEKQLDGSMFLNALGDIDKLHFKDCKKFLFLM